MHTRLICLVNEALDLNLEASATLLDDDLQLLSEQVQAKQQEIQTELDKTQLAIDEAFGKLHHKGTWEDGHKFGQVLKSLIHLFNIMRKLLIQQGRVELLEDGIKHAQFDRISRVRGIEVNQASVLEFTRTEICAVYSGNNVA